jgi:large subunit ribosomal protein L13Ae
VRFLCFLRKRCNTNHARGPFHLRSPSKMIWRSIRGMIPHKTARGKHAMARLKVFEGVPAPYDVKKRKVIPDALAVSKLRPTRTVTRLGRLSHEMGWMHQSTIATLEAKRKVRSAAFYKVKAAKVALRAKAAALVDKAGKAKILTEYGYGK